MRLRQMLDDVVEHVRVDWRFMVDQPVDVIAAWIESDRMLVVFRGRAGGVLFGLDCTDTSPIGTSDPSDDELAQEIAWYSILEPRGAETPRHPEPGRIYWQGSSTAHHPGTIDDLTGAQKVRGPSAPTG